MDTSAATSSAVPRSSSSVPPSVLSISDPNKKPSQIKFYRPAQMALFAHIVTYPPLAQVSIIAPSRKQVRLVHRVFRHAHPTSHLLALNATSHNPTFPHHPHIYNIIR